MAIAITAALVQKLRIRTGAGLMDCKRALEVAGGDLDRAAEAMHRLGQIHAEERAHRIAAEGLVHSESNSECAVIVEINCETDFVGRQEDFKQFVEDVAHLAASKKIESVELLLKTPFPETGQSVDKTQQALTARLGENIRVRRLALLPVQPGRLLGVYVHVGRIGAIVELQGGDEQLARNLALQIIANNPLVISSEDVSNEILTKEREIFTAQAQSSGKPQAVIDKMIEERVNKFLDEVSLLRQSFVQDETIHVREVLAGARAQVMRFVRYAVGEGIVKPTEDFAEAVMAQVHAS